MTETVEKATLQAEIKKAGEVCQCIKDALTGVEQKTGDVGIAKAFFNNQLKENQSARARMEMKLNKLQSESSSGAAASSTDEEAMVTGAGDIMIYVIHSHKDEAFVRPIMEHLQSKGLTVLHPEEDYKAGEGVFSNIENFIKQATRVVAVFSRNSLESEWVKTELLACKQAEVNGRKQLLIPILLDLNKEDLPLLQQDKHFIDARVAPYSSPDRKALHKRVEKEVFADDIPFIGNFTTGDIATGLAWSYYYGYLRLIIPTFTERLQKSEYWKKEGEKGNMSKRFIVLCPDSGKCHASLGNSDPRIKALATNPRSDEGYIEPVFKSRGGTPERPYKQGVYRIKMEDGEEYLAVAEYATPLLSMFEMEEHGLAGLGAEEKMYQKKMFVEVLKEILFRARIDEQVLLLSYDDTEFAANEFKYPIADDLVRVIKEEAAGSPGGQSMDTS